MQTDPAERDPASPAHPLTRAAALARLADFVPRAGSEYARLRNLERGAGAHVHVSRLSAALRRRVVAEAEVAQAVLDRHGRGAADRFLSEIFWRTYWKGWLEQRPAVWDSYLSALADARAVVERDPGVAARHAAACAGRTGIDCFDHWMGELAQTGYLHNWARMQVASIWVFTLGLRWELGADMMLGRLIDADPASNTLSWRWVAGLHTPGKTYLADPARIARMTGGRFFPAGLAQQATIPPDTAPAPPPAPPRAPARPDPALPTLVLITPEDLSLETEPALSGLNTRAVAALSGGARGDTAALSDALARAMARWQRPGAAGVSDTEVIDLAHAAGARQIVTGFAPVGPTAARLERLRDRAGASGVVLAEHLRDWDRHAWPHCRKGYFALKAMIPALLAANGLAGAADLS